jgi:transposase InsO family protein
VVGSRDIDIPGYLEIDLVSHSGDYAAGEWVHTLTATDIATGWTERVPVVGKGERGIIAALDRIRAQLPFPLRGIHSDNGSEFINEFLLAWSRARGVEFTRGRLNHKNDNPHVEQKNGALVRRYVGCERLDSPAQMAWLDRLYTQLLRAFNNCFQPLSN